MQLEASREPNCLDSKICGPATARDVLKQWHDGVWRVPLLESGAEC